MILVRAPLRIPFVGDGTDLLGFSTKYTGQVLSATINKFIYLLIKPTDLVDRYIVKYQTIENVTDPRFIKHDRIREALLHLEITNGGIEIASFADIPAKTGLGSSGSFTVALMKGLHGYRGQPMSKHEAAEAACALEIDILKEPIGKQDQYAAAYGGFNIFRFNLDASVDQESVLLGWEKRALLEQHLLLFYTGVTRDASSVLHEQTAHIDDHTATYKNMAAAVPDFHDALIRGDVGVMARLAHQEWEWKKTLASNVTNEKIDTLYTTGITAGAWGGKLLGAGSGGCILFFAPPDRQAEIREQVSQEAFRQNLLDFQEITFHFTQSGTDILYNDSSNRL